jgi:hypothetical protein
VSATVPAPRPEFDGDDGTSRDGGTPHAQDGPASAGARADRAVAEIIADFTGRQVGDTRGLVVDSPPGAGKSTLVVTVAAHLAAKGQQVMVVAQTNEQVDDLVARLADHGSSLTVGRLHSSTYQPPSRIIRDQVTVSDRLDELRDLSIVVSTAAKWAYAQDAGWQWAILDEAYQMRSDALLRVARLFADGRALFVGDPGQLDPFSTVETDRWQGQSWNPLRNAVDVTLGHNPGIPQRRLPVSWRLPTSATPLVQAAFYPFHAFTAGTSAGDRRLSISVRSLHADATDEVIDKAAASGWAFAELPNRHAPTDDSVVAAHLGTIAHRLLRRGTTAFCERWPEGRAVTAERIAIGVTHNAQAEAVRRVLRSYGGPTAGVTVDTANRLQGREFEVTLVWHPLSGRMDAGAFHLETGRLCVLLSRHRHACIVVGRAGIRELLDAHPATQPVYLDVPPKFPDGWRAHQAVLDHLHRPEHRVELT